MDYQTLVGIISVLIILGIIFMIVVAAKHKKSGKKEKPKSKHADTFLSSVDDKIIPQDTHLVYTKDGARDASNASGIYMDNLERRKKYVPAYLRRTMPKLSESDLYAQRMLYYSSNDNKDVAPNMFMEQRLNLRSDNELIALNENDNRVAKYPMGQDLGAGYSVATEKHAGGPYFGGLSIDDMWTDGYVASSGPPPTIKYRHRGDLDSYLA